MSKKVSKKKFDLISIGDCAIDAFIELLEARESWDKAHEHEYLTMKFADKIPYSNLTMLPAGNANNVSVGGSRLGLKTGFYGSIGKDDNGARIIQNLKKEKVDPKFLSIQPSKQTNFHIALVYRHERTILIKHEAFNYKLPQGISDTRWIYLTSVGVKGLAIHPQIVKLLKENPDIRLSFNPGTFQLRMGINKLAPLFKRTEILFVNKEEAELLLGYDSDDFKKLATDLAEYGPKTVVITDGLEGSYCLDDGMFYYVGVYPHKPKEATGCGDAFATGFTSARAYDLPVVEALRWGSRNGAGCAIEIGPQKGLLSKAQMIKDLTKSKNFQPRIIN